MPDIVNVHDAKTHFSRLLERARAGEEIVLAKAGRPYARLMPLAPTAPQRLPGRLKNRLGAGVVDAMLEPLPEDELTAWETR